MSVVALTGNDTIVINDRVMNDLAEGDVAMLEFPTDIATVKTGKNGNTVYALNEGGRQADFKLRLIRGSSDDKYLQGLLASQQANFAEFVLMTGQFVKQLGDGAGNVLADTYITSGGIFVKQVAAKTNTDGDSNQSVAEYSIKFGNAPRVLT